VSGVTDYEIFRSTNETGNYTSIGTTSYEYNDTGVTAGATYWYKVRAVNGAGPGPDSAAVSVTLPGASPAALAYDTWAEGNLATGTRDWYTLTAGYLGTYSLQWDDKYDGTGYYTGDIAVRVYRSDRNRILWSDSGYTNPPYFDLSVGETVYVLAESYSAGNYAIRYYDYDSANLPLQTPSDVRATGLPPPISVIAVTWYSVSGATSYEVSRSTSEMGTYTKIGTVSNSPWSYTDTNVTASVTYWYKVKAVNDTGSGPYSTAVSAALPNASPTALPNDAAWTTGTLATETQTDWYTFTAGSAGAYYLQGDSSYYGSGTYLADIMVRVYRPNGTMMSSGDSIYITPLFFTLSAGETVYVMVEPYQDESIVIGTYGIRYYQ
jgi:hypothetical protein